MLFRGRGKPIHVKACSKNLATVDLFLSDRMLKVNRDISLFVFQQAFLKILISVKGILADLSLVHPTI